MLDRPFTCYADTECSEVIKMMMMQKFAKHVVNYVLFLCTHLRPYKKRMWSHIVKITYETIIELTTLADACVEHMNMSP